jgi:hypothetical protein
MLEATETKAAAIIERCKYELTGYVLTCPTRQTKAIVDLASTRWFPDPADFARVMVWKDPKGPGTPEEGFELEAAAVPVPLVAPAAASRPVLTAPPSAKLLESTEAALGALARELGCAFNDDIPHNAGWFVPGKPTAHASAYDAIRGLFASLEAGGTVYRAPAAAVEVPQLEAPAPKADEPQLELAQGALF